MGLVRGERQWMRRKRGCGSELAQTISSLPLSLQDLGPSVLGDLTQAMLQKLEAVKDTDRGLKNKLIFWTVFGPGWVV